MTKNRVLPFKTLPKAEQKFKTVGNETLGMLDVPVYGYLHIGEFDEFLTLVDDIDVLKKMFTKTSKNTVQLPGGEAPAAAVAALTGEAPKVEQSDSEKLSNLELGKFMLQYSRETATIIIRYRIDPEWQLEDTARLPLPLVHELSAIFQDELREGGSARSLSEQFGADEEDDKGKAETTTSEPSS